MNLSLQGTKWRHKSNGDLTAKVVRHNKATGRIVLMADGRLVRTRVGNLRSNWSPFGATAKRRGLLEKETLS
jgi:hypothetical protein